MRDDSIDMQRVQERVAMVAVEHNPILPTVKRSDPIGVLRLRKRTKNMLNNARIWLMRELLSKRPSELIKIRACGYVTLSEIQTELAARGFRLKEDK